MFDPSLRASRLDDYLDRQDLEALWFARPGGFTWLVGGSNVIDRDADIGIAAAGYDGTFRVVTSNVEAERLRQEELSDVVSVESFPWHERWIVEAVTNRSPTPAAADFDVPGFDTIDIDRLRYPLSEHGVDRYRLLGRDAAAAVEKVCRELDAEDLERDVARAIETELSSGGMNAPVVLVGGAERAGSYRHFTPTDAPLGSYVLVSVTAERDGLYASLTRTVAFDPPEWLLDRHRAAMRIEATALAATRAAALGVLDGTGTSGDVFAAIREAYDTLGFEGEWRHHHQGGVTGYAAREWVATPAGTEPVREPMAYAWNPTVQGTKSEDTHLIAGDRTETLTTTGAWPTRTVEPVPIDGLDINPSDVIGTIERHVPFDA